MRREFIAFLQITLLLRSQKDEEELTDLLTGLADGEHELEVAVKSP